MNVVGKQEIEAFSKKHAQARKPLQHWLTIAEGAAWKSPQDVKGTFSTASFLSENRVIFNIKGNSFRLLVHAVYEHEVLRILKIGTHNDYDSWQF